jgi:hypothetical protein
MPAPANDTFIKRLLLDAGVVFMAPFIVALLLAGFAATVGISMILAVSLNILAWLAIMTLTFLVEQFRANTIHRVILGLISAIVILLFTLYETTHISSPPDAASIADAVAKKMTHQKTGPKIEVFQTEVIPPTESSPIAFNFHLRNSGDTASEGLYVSSGMEISKTLLNPIEEDKLSSIVIQSGRSNMKLGNNQIQPGNNME